MATRRHRIVIKPNIRPAAAKAGPTGAPKQKTPSSIVSDCPSPAIRQQLVPLEETHQLTANEDDREDAVDCGDIFKQDSSAVLPEDNAALVAELGGADSEQSPSFVTIKSKSEAEGQGESAAAIARNEKALIDVHCVSTEEDASVKESSYLSAKSSISAGTPVHQKTKSMSETANLATKRKDKHDSEEVIKDVDDDNGGTPSEADGSCMSDVMSLDPDNERIEEVGDKAQKKPRRNKSKKLRAEPLPSREKSPDRQKMKMSDLLCWNPQQNSLPKKNKKKSTLKNENNSAASPTPSLTALDDDKESTNQSTSLPAPQVMIGPDGCVILNTESLIIQTQKDDGPKEVLEDNDEDRYLNTNSYRKYKKAKLWSEIETEQFFVGLSMCGTDFSLLTNLLTHRSRRELKNKFHREERRNRELIDKALSKRQQYDLTPFKKMAAEEDKKVKKSIKKQFKKEALKDEKATRRQRKKRKKESEDEEADWVPEYDEEDEENQNKNVGSDILTDAVVVTQKSKGPKVKKETDYQNKSKQVDQNFPGIIPEDKSKPFLPGYPTASVPSAQDGSAAQVPVPDEYTDLDNPRMRSRPAKTYSRLGSQSDASQQTPPSANPGTNFASSSSVIQAIPGSSQVQIEMEGVQNPVQGVLIPSHMVPHIAPQLGIYGSTAGMQVLLVQEETESGSLVHVYVLPESDTVRVSGDNVDGGLPGSGNHLSFSSPIPSPHPSTSIPSPHPISPFPASCSPHPLSSVCSPQHIPSFQSPPTLLNHTPGDAVHSPSTMYTPAQTQSPHPQSASTKPNLDTSLSHEEHQDMVVIMPPPAGNYPISRQSKNTSAVKHSFSGNSERTLSNYPDNHFTPASADTNFTSLSLQSASLPHDTSIAISYQTASMFPHGSGSEVIVVVDDNPAVKVGDAEANGSSYNSGSVVVVPGEAIEDDCIMIDTDRPQSRVDMSGV